MRIESVMAGFDLTLAGTTEELTRLAIVAEGHGLDYSLTGVAGSPRLSVRKSGPNGRDVLSHFSRFMAVVDRENTTT